MKLLEAQMKMKNIQNKSVINKSVFKNNIIIKRKFIGKELNAIDAKIFQEIVNERRPYCSFDFRKQYFTPNNI